jgi:hypothetical protein
MRRLPRHLRHPDGILEGIESVKGRRVAVELVAENENEMAGHRRLEGRRGAAVPILAGSGEIGGSIRGRADDVGTS